MLPTKLFKPPDLMTVNLLVLPRLSPLVGKAFVATDWLPTEVLQLCVFHIFTSPVVLILILCVLMFKCTRPLSLVPCLALRLHYQGNKVRDCVSACVAYLFGSSSMLPLTCSLQQVLCSGGQCQSQATTSGGQCHLTLRNVRCLS